MNFPNIFSFVFHCFRCRPWPVWAPTVGIGTHGTERGTPRTWSILPRLFSCQRPFQHLSLVAQQIPTLGLSAEYTAPGRLKETRPFRFTTIGRASNQWAVFGALTRDNTHLSASSAVTRMKLVSRSKHGVITNVTLPGGTHSRGRRRQRQCTSEARFVRGRESGGEGTGGTADTTYPDDRPSPDTGA